MAKSQLNIRPPENLEIDVEEYREENGLDTKSEAGRQLLRRGVDRWREQDQEGRPMGARILSRGAELAFISGLFAAIVGIGLDAVQLFELAAGFGLVAIALYGAYGVLMRYKTGAWGAVV